MGRPTKKADLIIAAKANYEKLNILINSMSEKELLIPFCFAGDDKKKRLIRIIDKNLQDTLIHLYEWHKLILNWVASNTSCDEKPFLPVPYTWKTYGNMNLAFG